MNLVYYGTSNILIDHIITPLLQPLSVFVCECTGMSLNTRVPRRRLCQLCYDWNSTPHPVAAELSETDCCSASNFSGFKLLLQSVSQRLHPLIFLTSLPLYSLPTTLSPFLTYSIIPAPFRLTLLFSRASGGKQCRCCT